MNIYLIRKLNFSDSGQGMKTFPETKGKSLGIRLIEMMSRQIDGEAIKTSQNGIEYLIRFKQD